MSILVTVYLKDYIVMAAESRVTGDRILPDKTKEKCTLSDNGQKLFLLADRFGLSTCGIRVVGDRPVSEFISDFEKSITPSESTRDVANRLCELAIEKQALGTVFHVCGFDEGIRSVFSAENGELKLWADKSNAGDCSFICSGAPEVVSKFYSGEDPFSIDWAYMEQKDAIDFAAFLVESTCLVHRFQSQLGTCGGPVDILLLTEKDAKWIRHKVYDL